MNSIAPSPMSSQNEHSENSVFATSNKKVSVVQLREESRKNLVNISNDLEHDHAVIEIPTQHNHKPDDEKSSCSDEDRLSSQSKGNSFKSKPKEKKPNSSENHPKGMQQKSSHNSIISAARNPSGGKVESSEEIKDMLKTQGDNPNIECERKQETQLDKLDGNKQIESATRNDLNNDPNKHEKNYDTGLRINHMPPAIAEENDLFRTRNLRTHPSQVLPSLQQQPYAQVGQPPERHDQVDKLDIANLDGINNNHAFSEVNDESESNSQQQQLDNQEAEVQLPQESLNHNNNNNNNNASSSHSNQQFNNRIYPLNNRLHINNNNQNNQINNLNLQHHSNSINNNNHALNWHVSDHLHRASSNLVYPQDQPQLFLGVSAYELHHMVKVLLNFLKFIVFSTPLNIAVIVATIIGLNYIPDSNPSNALNANCNDTRAYFLGVQISLLILTVAVLACDGSLFYTLRYREGTKLLNKQFNEMKLSLSDLQDLQSLLKAVWKRFQPFGYLQILLKMGQFIAAVGSLIAKSAVGSQLQADCSSFDDGYIPQKVATMILFANLIEYGALIAMYTLCYLIFLCVQWTEDQTQINKSIKNCRTFTYNDPIQLGKCDCTCIICYNDYVKDEQLSVLPCPAGHIYHQTCVSYWLDIKRSCPTCKHQF